MSKIQIGTENGAPIELYYEDHGVGKPVILIHGWPLSGRTWENQTPALVEAGYRVIVIDRRGFGASSQPWSGYDYDTFAADLDKLIEHLDLHDVTLIGFSMGGGEVVRYIGKYGTSRIAKAVLASAVTPFLYKSEENPDGALDDVMIATFQEAIKTDRVAYMDEFTTNLFSAKGVQKVSEAQRIYARGSAVMASPKGTAESLNAFARTDFHGDIKKMTIPTLVIHGDSDVVVPFEASGKLSAALIEGSTLHVVKDGPHGINASHAEEFNRELLAFMAS